MQVAKSTAPQIGTKNSNDFLIGLRVAQERNLIKLSVRLQRVSGCKDATAMTRPGPLLPPRGVDEFLTF